MMGRLRNPVRPAAEVLSVELLCSNRDLPEQIPFGGSQSASQKDFTLPGHPAAKRVRLLRKPTPSLRPPARRGLQWRLISHLSLNYLSLVADGKPALQEMLRLYNLSGSAFLENHIKSIAALDSAPHFARVASPHGIVFAHGTRVQMEVDEDLFSGGGAWLFTAVLDRFLAHYVSMNSFSQLIANSPKRRQPLYQWEPRAGSRMLL